MTCGPMRLLTGVLLAVSVAGLVAQGAQPQAPPTGQPPAQTPPAQTPAAQTPPAQSSPAQAPPAQPEQPPAFRTGINFVRVDALVTDNRGNAIADLTQDDFEVYEDNKLQKVETFRYVKVEGNPLEGELPRQIRTTWDEETELARDDVRLFVIFFDDYHVRRGSPSSSAGTSGRWTSSA
jgi:hypothetical protein